MIPLHRPYISDEELVEIKKVLDSRWLTQGPKGKEFEKSVQDYLGVEYVVACSSCTAALHLSLMALNLPDWSNVLVADYSYPATSHAVKYCDYIPIFVDVDPFTYNIDMDDLKRKINANTTALILVHTFGQCADMDPILQFANDKGLYLIEDAACAMGSKYKNRFAGTMGDINCFSFHATKGVGIGEGGMITTNNKELADRARKFAYFGIESSWTKEKSNEFSIPVFDTLGYNYKLSDVSAAMGVVQMRKVDKVIKKKRILAQYWDMKLQSIDEITAPFVDPNCFHNYQGYTTVVSKKIDRNKLITVLKDRGVQTQIGTYACHTQPVYKTDTVCPTSLDIYNRALRLPMFYELTTLEIDKAAAILKESLNECYINKRT
jgi:perosamine synthetase